MTRKAIQTREEENINSGIRGNVEIRSKREKKTQEMDAEKTEEREMMAGYFLVQERNPKVEEMKIGCRIFSKSTT